MKKNTYLELIPLLLIALFLTACTQSSPEANQQTLTSSSQSPHQESSANRFPDQQPLPDSLSKTLIKSGNPNKTIEIYEDFSLTINHIKVTQEEMPSTYQENDPYLLSFFKDSHFYYLELTITAVNNREESVDYPGFEYVVTDQRQQIQIFYESGMVKWPSTFQPGTSTTIKDYKLRLLPNNLEQLTDFVFWTPEILTDNPDDHLESLSLEITI